MPIRRFAVNGTASASAKRTAARIEAGLCVKCGKTEPLPERRLCAPCNKKRNAASRGRDARLRAERKPRRDPRVREAIRTRARPPAARVLQGCRDLHQVRQGSRAPRRARPASPAPRSTGPGTAPVTPKQKPRGSRMADATRKPGA